MQVGLNAVLAALDSAPALVHFFVRDDDAGWDDARLLALLACTGHAGVPVDLAVIPQAVSEMLATELRARMSAAPRLIGVHQHGFAHINHETAARKCEFGSARGIDAQRRDLCAGRERLRELFGARLDAIFTPPWNRCSAATPALLAELGYAALSRDRGAPAQRSLPELVVDLDWCKERRLAATDRGCAGDAIALALARRIGTGNTVGLMLHHAEMDARDFARLAALLDIAARHRRACWLPMRELIAVQALPAASVSTFPQTKLQ